MLPEQRREFILNKLKDSRVINTAELAKTLYTTEMTIRRDLKLLENKNLVKRVYGGAMLIEGSDIEIPLSVREKKMHEEKKHIGKLAASLINNDDIVIIDSSSTSCSIIPYLSNKTGLTIITNGLKTATMAGELTNAKVYCLGGRLRENSQSFVGVQCVNSLRYYNANKLFFSCRGVDIDKGIMDSSDEEAHLRREMIIRSKEVYLLADSTKIGNTSFYTIGGFESINCFITDLPLNFEYSTYFNDNNIDLRYCFDM